MKPLTSIAKQRLAATLMPEAHPDLGVLTAFVEHSLGRTKRDQIFRHLAICTRCNQLVALAAPEPADVLPVPVPERTWRQLGFRPWRWATGTALAGALALAAIWMVRPLPVAGPPAHVSSPTSLVAAASSQPAPLASVPPSTSTPSVQRGPKSPRPTADSLPETAHLTVARPQPDGRLRPYAAEVTMQSAPPPISDLSTQTSVPDASSTQVPPPMSIVAAPAAGPCWRVSGAGALEKSLSCADGWVPMSMPEPVVARVVQSVGSILWVGGNRGALYHSADAGQHWNKVSVPSLSDDVVAIAFGTPTHGWLSTSNGENWVTTDGGLTWKRR